MKRWTTPTLILTVLGIDLTGYHTEVTIKQGDYVVIKENPPVQVTEEGCILTVFLTQEETAGFESGDVAGIQIRFIDRENLANATNIKTVYIDDVLREGEIEYTDNETNTNTGGD